MSLQAPFRAEGIMALIKDNDIVTLKKYVKMSFTASAVNSMPDLEGAEREYIIPVLTQAVYDALQDQVNNNNITWPILLNFCRAAAAPLAVYTDLPFMQASIEDGGIKTTHSTNKEAAHQWEYKGIEEALLNKGTKALDQLIEHLLTSGSNYNWDNADTKESFFHTGKDFTAYFTLYQANITFEQLKPLVREVEDHFIRAAIGDDFFAELRDKPNPGAEEKKAILLIKKAIANYTAVRAVERLPVKITPYGMLASIENASRETRPATPATTEQLNMLMQSAQREGDSYQIQLMEYLNITAAASDTIFSTFKASAYYKAPVPVVPVVPVVCDPNQPYHHHHEHNHYRRGVVAIF